MKSKTVMVSGIVAIGIVTLLVVGCQLPFPLKAATEHDRISLFKDAINGGDYNDIMTCFSTNVSIYNQMNTPSFWDGSQYSQNYASFSISTSTAATADSSGNYTNAMYESESISSHNGGATGQIQFWLVNPTGDNWQICELQLGGAASQASGPNANDIW